MLCTFLFFHSFLHCALETSWLGLRKTCGIGLSLYRPLFEKTSWLGAGLYHCVLRNKLAGLENVFSMCRDATVCLKLVQQPAAWRRLSLMASRAWPLFRTLPEQHCLCFFMGSCLEHYRFTEADAPCPACPAVEECTLEV